ncbi:MAG TPA: 4-hydroxy-tetrahydrodipicolinate reductase [Longimicrobiaceae bacterium]|nr:4-hydroxy-tetrahydrodipicolinate reductase [Longimicrobiaceae bacterium]
MGVLRVVVSGAAGRMGATLAALASEDPEIELVGGIDRAADAPGYPRTVAVDSAAELIRQADAVVDFSAPAFLRQLLETQAEALRGRALVVGTTGLGADEERLLDQVAGASPVLTAANFSVGVNLLVALAERAARVLGVEYDVEIVEAHHRRKEDAPSGTALALGAAVAEGRGVDLAAVRRDGRSGRPGPRPEGEIGFHSLRGGSLVGEHEVLFLGGRDRIELAHRASDRGLFAAGALRAARWLAGRPAGRYQMRDVLGL